MQFSDFKCLLEDECSSKIRDASSCGQSLSPANAQYPSLTRTNQDYYSTKQKYRIYKWLLRVESSPFWGKACFKRIRNIAKVYSLLLEDTKVKRFVFENLGDDRRKNLILILAWFL